MDELQARPSFPLSVNHMIWAIRRQKGVIIVLTLLGLGAAKLFITIVPPKYAASSQLIFDIATEEFINTDRESRAQWAGQQAFASAVAIIGSSKTLKPVALKIMSRLERSNPPVTAIEKILAQPDLASEERITALIKRLEKNLNVTTPAVDQVVVIEYKSSSPGEAAYVANLVAATFLEQRAASRKASLAQATGWLDERSSEAKNKLIAIDRKIQDFKATHRIENERGSSALEEELTQTRSQLSAVQARLAEARTVYETLRASASQSASDYERLAESIGGATMERLRSSLADAEGALASAKVKLGAYHPDVQAQRSHVAAIKAEMAAEARRKELGSKLEVEQLTSREHALQKGIGTLESKMRDLRASEVQLLELQREREVTKTLYDSMLAKLMQTSLQQTLNFGQFKVELEATLPKHPKLPPVLFLAAGTVFGLGFGLFAILALEILQDRVVVLDDIKRRLGVKIITQVPLISKKDFDGASAVKSYLSAAKDFPKSLFANKLIAAHMAVNAINNGERCKVILITSPTAGDGKTHLTSNLASLSVMLCRKTLFIDFDARKAGETAEAAVDPKYSGLNSFLRQHNLEDVFTATHRTGAGDYDVLRVRASNEAASLRFFQTQAGDLLQFVRENYDYAWIDTPPARIFNDPLIIAKQVDGVMIVAEWSKTTIRQLKNTINLVQESDGDVLGVIINKVRVDPLISETMVSYGAYYRDRKHGGRSHKS